MTRRRTIQLILLVIVAAIAALVALLLPPPTSRLDSAALLNAPVVRGAYHVHSSRSDGSGTLREIAAAAGRAGLGFVIVTDHGDATRTPEPPAYHDGVLVIDAVEISAGDGHVVALGMPASPFPLAGEARDVIADITRLNGVAMVAHPGSPKPGLRWTDWVTPFHGLEWINGDSEWRDESAGALARTLLTYPLRSSQTLAALLDRPVEVLRHWDEQLAIRPVVALAAGDAHARLGLRGEPSDSRIALPLPSYEEVFRTMSIGIPRLALAGEAAADAEAIVTAIIEGNVFSAIDALARPASFAMTASSSGIQVGVGGRLPVGAPVDLSVASNAPAGSRINLLKDGKLVVGVDGAALRHTAAAGPGVYRVEIVLRDAPGTPPVPWILSNPIYVRPPWAAPPARPPGTQRAVLYSNGPATGWTVEQSAHAKGAIDVAPAVEGTEVALRYALGGAPSAGPYVAVTMPAGAIAGYDRMSFQVRAVRPMRVSVELRVPSGLQGERWSRSIYVDETPREATVFFDEMRPRGATSAARPDLAKVDRVLFVVDSTTTPAGSNGLIWIDEIAYER
jgi:hypothetical protein